MDAEPDNPYYWLGSLSMAAAQAATENDQRTAQRILRGAVERYTRSAICSQEQAGRLREEMSK